MDELVTNRCSQVQKICVPKDWVEGWKASTNDQCTDEIQKELDAVLAACHMFERDRFVKMANKRVWFDRDAAGLYPKIESCNMPYCSRSMGVFRVTNDDVSNFQLAGKRFVSMNVDGIEFVMPKVREAQKTFLKGNGNPYIADDGTIKYNKKAHRENQFVTENYEHDDGLQTYCTNGNDDYWYDVPILLIPIHHLGKENDQPLTFAQSVLKWLEYDLIPVGMTSGEVAHWEALQKHREIFSYLAVQGNRIVFRKEDFLQATQKSTQEQTNDGKVSAELVKAALLACDKRRADLSPYPEMYVTDINKGHWELFENLRAAATDDADCVTVELPEGQSWVARPPQMDVKEDGICAIDFGTKSTVVVCQDTEPRLLRIGTGDVRKAATEKDYENPTVIELRDVAAFRAAYAARSGRPFTEWEQITVSHQAENALREQNAGSDTYDAVFGELKQWANDAHRQLRLRDRKKALLELAPYRELAEDAFDPIEVYAYYLGLYINNMRHKIYLDYILSFPVNYSKDVRERLLGSFARGLKKSLPPAILADEACMENFRVYAGASEPAAYAAIALKELDLEPKQPEQVTAYGVFDFGGGTTDFDFGIESLPANRRKFRYEIEQFGRGGDAYLGGEHLLDLLAYEVFVQNLELLRKDQLTIVRPHDGRRVDGAETLILEPDDASQTARMNRKVLAEALRPLWEHTPGFEKLGSEPLTVNLFRSDGDDPQEKKACALNVDVHALETCLHERIERGVANFFDAMMTAFRDRDDLPDTIHVLLAGHSCQSPIVRELFEDYCTATRNRIAEEWHEDNPRVIELHAPLGIRWETAAKEMAENTEESAAEAGDTAAATERAENAAPRERLDQRITGKTGVAFGLLRSRKGGRDVRFVNHDVDESGEAVFPYFLGVIEDDRFHVMIDKSVGYGTWAPLTYADEEVFELYYTTEASAPSNMLARRDVQMKKCRLHAEDVSDDEDVMAFVRKTKPDAIEYATGKAEEFSGGDLGDIRIYTKQLT